MAQAQDGSGIDPTDAEAWDCLVQNSHCLENRAPNKVRDSITEIIRRTWGIQGHDINTHDLALVWLDPRSKVLATRLVEVGPGRDVFDIDMIHRMKLYRLGGVSRRCLIWPDSVSLTPRIVLGHPHRRRHGLVSDRLPGRAITCLYAGLSRAPEVRASRHWNWNWILLSQS